MGLQEGLIGEK
jgi:hypothetical protein